MFWFVENVLETMGRLSFSCSAKARSPCVLHLYQAEVLGRGKDGREEGLFSSAGVCGQFSATLLWCFLEVLQYM